MCFGEEHNWRTFLIGAVFVGLSLYYYGGKSQDNLVMSLIIVGIVLMQLWEAIAWRGYCNFASWAAYLTLLAQTLPLLILVPRSIKTARGKLALCLIVMYYATVFIGAGAPPCMLKDGQQIRYTWHDKWWQQVGYLVVLGLVPLLLMKDQVMAWLWSGVFFLSLMVTHRVYGALQTNGAIWCYYGALSAAGLFAYLAIKG